MLDGSDLRFVVFFVNIRDSANDIECSVETTMDRLSNSETGENKEYLEAIHKYNIESNTAKEVLH